MLGYGARPYATEKGSDGERDQIWVLQLSPAVFRPFVRYWRFLLPSTRWRVIVTRETRTIPIIVDARFFEAETNAKHEVSSIKRRIASGHSPRKHGT